MADPMFQFTGVTSQIDWGSMLDKIMEKARKPEELWTAEKDKLELKKGLYEELSTGLKQLRTDLASLKLPSTYQQKAAEFATLEPAGRDSKSIVTATVDTSAAINQWKIKVNQTALSERRVSDRYDSVSDALNLAGTFRVYVGKQWADISVTTSDSLRDINLKLQKALDSNNQPLAVSAKIVDNRIVLESSSSGLGNSGPKSSETFTMGSSDSVYLPREVNGNYPNSVTIKAGSTTYYSGVDFTYDASKGLISWTGGNKPTSGTQFTVTYSQDTETVTRAAAGDVDTLASTPYPGSISIKQGATNYTEGVHFTYNNTNGEITWLTATRPAASSDYTVTHLYSSNDNVFQLEDITGTVISGTRALGTGLGMAQTSNHTAAQDAKLEIDDLAVTRSSNEITDLIAGVKLKLVGPGTVNMDVTLNAEQAVKATQEFVSVYNEVMDWINVRLTEETQVDSSSKDDQYKNDDFYKKFGLLHGDSMLWQVKDQLRQFFSNPVTAVANTQSTKSFSSTTTALGMTGNVTVDIAGMRTKIAVSPSDSLETLRAKLTGAKDQTESSSGTAKGGDLPISVSIVNGRLVIQSTSTDTNATATRTESIVHNNGTDSDLLPFTPNTEPPISGRFRITQGSTVYEENVDYKVTSVDDPLTGTTENRVVWMSGKRPSAAGAYTVTYTYAANKASVSTDGSSLDLLDFSSGQHEDGTLLRRSGNGEGQLRQERQTGVRHRSVHGPHDGGQQRHGQPHVHGHEEPGHLLGESGGHQPDPRGEPP